jgi:signal peptidase II
MLQNQQPLAPARSWLIVALVFAATLALDLASKQWVWNNLRPPTGEPLVLWEGVFEFAFAYNRGTAFSLVRQVEHPIVFLPITVLVLGWVGYTVAKIGHGRLRFFALGLVIGGALGNLHDRLFRVDALGDHGVVDFIVVHYPWGGSWPSFNVADSALVVGTILLVWCLRKGPTDA